MVGFMKLRELPTERFALYFMGEIEPYFSSAYDDLDAAMRAARNLANRSRSRTVVFDREQFVEVRRFLPRFCPSRPPNRTSPKSR